MADLTCPHCRSRLLPFELPEAAGWSAPFHLACFNDDCSYYRRAWEWMKGRYGVWAAYRFRLDPASGTASPLPVWSPDALKDRILDAEVEVHSGTGSEMAGGLR